MRPLAALLPCAAAVVVAVAAPSPLVLAAAAAGAAALLAAAGRIPRAATTATAVSALLVFAVNPFAGVQGLTTLWQGPSLPVLDTQVTVEELVFGAAAALRILAAGLAVTAFVRLADADLTLRAVARVAPRSALVAALSARLLPTLERDAAGLRLAARTRGARLAEPAAAAALLPALLASSLERSLNLAEAMEARGYGAGPRTRAPVRPFGPRERSVAALGAVSLTLAVAGRAAGWDAFRYYDTLGDPFRPTAVALALALAAALLASAVAVRWRS